MSEVTCSVSANKNYLVAVIGAGPAGLYAAQYLARQGVTVVLFNRDIKPGGLAEYGIFPDKHKMRVGLMAAFKRILELPSITYQGNVTVGQIGDVTIDQLRQAGFQAFMVTTGAQQTNELGLPGEDLEGVYHANEVVFHYNRLPSYAHQRIDIGHRVAIIGVGNVMLDVVNYLRIHHSSCMVTAFARRSPTEVKFDQPTLEPVAGCLDLEAIRAAVDEARPQVEKVGKDVDQFFSLLAAAQAKSVDCETGLTFKMQFLRSPQRILGDEAGRVKAVQFEINRLVCEDGKVVPRGTGQREVVPADTVIVSIGSHVDPSLGMPVADSNYVTTSTSRFPVDGISYEVEPPEGDSRYGDVFVSGWARLAGEGIVGLARKDAERGARALLRYLETVQPISQRKVDDVLNGLMKLVHEAVDLNDLETLWAEESQIAAQKGLLAYKFDSNAEMLKVIKRGSTQES